MSKHRFLLIICCFFAATLAYSQSQNAELKINYLRQGTGAKVEIGQIVTLSFAQQLLKDTVVLNKRQSNGPIVLQTTEPEGDPVMEVLLKTKVGDSIMFSIAATQLLGPGQSLPPGLDSTMNIQFNIGIIGTQAKEAYEAAIRQKKEAALKLEDDAIMQYAAANGLKTQKTASGLHYAVITEGTGAKAQPGEEVEVHYTGLLLDGTKFDSSVDRGEPFSFPVGTQRVIPGWDEGFLLFNEGTKAVLLIPSHLGYGERGAGQVIKPYSILRFDVEFIRILK